MLPISMRIREHHNGPVLFERAFATEAEYQRVGDLCIDREPISNSLFFLIRTNTWGNFCEDFFFPGLMTALKTKDFVEGIFISLICFVGGLLTLPIRCITLIPRYFQNQANRKETHPLYKYLSENGADPHLLNRDFIYVSKRTLTNRPDGQFNVSDSSNPLRFIELPQGEAGGDSSRSSITGVSLEDLQLI